MTALAFIDAYGATVAILSLLMAGALATVTPAPRAMAVLAVTAASGVAALSVAPILRHGGGVDPLGAGAAMLLALVAAVAFVAAGPVLAREFDRRTRPIALGLALMTLGAALAVVLARDVLTMAIALIGGGMVSAALTALAVARDRAAAHAAFAAVLSTLCAGALALSGAGLLYAALGSFDFAAETAVVHADGARGAVVGAALLAAACAVMAGVAPAHGWTADVAAHTPHGGAVVVTVVARIAGFIALVRILTLTQADPLANASLGFAYASAALGALGVAVGSIQAIGATDARRLAAHALTAQFGCALIGLGAGGLDGAIAALFVVAAGAMTALALIVGAAAARPQLGASAPMSALDGLARQRPLVAAGVAVAAFGLTGAPLTAAFLGKWLSVEAALARGWYWAAIAVVGASFAAVFVAGQLIERMYFRERSAQIGPAPSGALALAPALVAAAAATLVFGWNGAAPLEAMRIAARAMAGAP
jgi:NADH:ubiquinone oxidoreductase subunit 2 (subunit N)